MALWPEKAREVRAQERQNAIQSMSPLLKRNLLSMMEGRVSMGLHLKMRNRFNTADPLLDAVGEAKRSWN